jgi:CheY-like chemotaxis protein
MVANSGRAALEILAKTSFDMVLMDIQMPDMSGYEVTEIVRRDPRLIDMPVIALSAHVLEDARASALASGMNDFIAKPIDPERFYMVVSKYLALSASEAKGGKIDDPTQAILQPISGVEVLDGLPRSGWNVPLYIKLLRDFSRYHADDVKMLKRLLNQADESEAQGLLHSLKGAAGNIGANQLYLSCQKVEKHMLDGISENDLTELQHCLKEVMNGISKLPQNQEHGKSQLIENPIPWNELVPEMAGLLKQGNVRAIDLLPSVLLHASDRQPELVARLEEMLDRYRFDEALQVLEQIDAAFGGDG